MNRIFSVDAVRAAERPLLENEDRPDALMQTAAHAVTDVARSFRPHSVLVLAGSGGNGGDALYAGAELALAGSAVSALLTAERAHSRALEAFRNAGGKTVEDLPTTDPDLIIDGITGIGGSAGLRNNLKPIVEYTENSDARVLSVDVPSGVAADTGRASELHITADVTITFGGWRRAHALAPECGLQLLAEIPELVDRFRDQPSDVSAYRAITSDLDLPDYIHPLPHRRTPSVAPTPFDDKYSGGVVGIRAGSGTYPGAALLPVAAALGATPAMVRYAGPQALEVVRRHPEVIVTETLRDAGRVQAWVFGPGAGTDDDAATDLEWILDQEVPVLIDADGLTLLAQHDHLRDRVRQRSEPTVLTPHDGEFARLHAADGDRLSDTMDLAKNLNATVLRKGRSTIVTDGARTDVLDAGHSWAATPGSGDVLSGIIGARIALPHESNHVLDAAAIHAVAAKLAARTEFGDAPAPASRIADFVREATALTS